MPIRIVIVGAGAVGASIAAFLAERGASVTVVDAGAPGGGTSSTSFAWVNSNGKEPDDYFEINRAGLEAHRRLPGNSAWLGTGGHVEIAVSDDHSAAMQHRIDRLKARDYDVRLLTHDAAAHLLPDVRVPKDARLIAHFPREGYLHPSLYIGGALGRARAAGAQFRFGHAVIDIHESGSSGGTVVLSDGSEVSGDFVISAVGRWTEEVAALAGARVPMLSYATPGDETVGYLVETAPLAVQLDHIVTSPELNFRPAGGGRLLLQALDLDVTADPTAPIPRPDSDLAQEFMRRLSAIVIGAESAEVQRLLVGQRALPDDGRTIAGVLDNQPWLYVIATHSGITLAPFLGDAVADEIMGSERAELMAFRPNRFQSGTPYTLTGAPRLPGEQ